MTTASRWSSITHCNRVGLFQKVLFCFLAAVFGVFIWSRSAAANIVVIDQVGESSKESSTASKTELDKLIGQPIAELRFQGNRRVESEAMLLELSSASGQLLSKSKVAADIRSLWSLGYFEDIKVLGELGSAGVVLTFRVKERPTVNKIIVEGNNKVKLDDINEVLDLEKNQVLDLGKVSANVEKVRSLYSEKGFFLAQVNYSIRPVEEWAGKVDVVLVITEAEEVIIRTITFVGNKALSDKQLRKNMFTRVGAYLSQVTKRAGGVYNRDAFAQDYAILRQFYADAGYMEADFHDAELALSPDRRFVHITIPVVEGPKYRIGEIKASEDAAEGDVFYGKEQLQSFIDPVLRKGSVASMSKINQIRENLELRYKDHGYAYVNVVVGGGVNREKNEYFVTYDIQKGPLVYIERIEIAGNERTADKVIRREIEIQEGDLYSESAKEGTQMLIFRLGFFSEVNVSTARGSADDQIVLNIEVTEKLTGSFNVGAGFSTIESFVLSAQINYDNFLHRGSSVQLVANLSGLRRLFNLSYYTRYFLDTKWNFILNVFNSRNIFPSFTRQSTGFSLSFGYPIPKLRALTAFAGYDLENVKVSFDGPGPAGGLFTPGASSSVPTQQVIRNLFSNGITSALTFRLSYEGRDSILFPTQGHYHQVNVKLASKYFGSHNRYNRYDLDSRFYFPVIKTDKSFRAWLVFKTRLQVGYIHNNEARGVPIFERYFPGGIYGDGGIRGFPLRSLGPRITVFSSPNPTARLVSYSIGGNLLTSLNAELEGMILPPANIKGVLFFDSGNAFNTEGVHCVVANPKGLPKSDPCSPFGFRNLRYSVGLGLRWQSPIGPLRFEWGFPLDRLKRTELVGAEEKFTFEFNVGTGF